MSEFESDVISIEEVEQFIEYLKSIAKHIQGYSYEVSKAIRGLEIAKNMNISTGACNKKDIYSILDSYGKQADFEKILTYSALKQLILTTEFTPDFMPIAAELKESLNVKLYIKDEILCIKTPTLLSKRGLQRDRRFGFYIAQLLSEHRDELPVFDEKYIIVFNVYSKQHPAIFEVDPDNIDAKNIIDMICGYYKGDSGRSTIYISMMDINDEVPEGTYTLCMSQQKNHINKNEILNIIKGLLRSKN